MSGKCLETVLIISKLTNTYHSSLTTYEDLCHLTFLLMKHPSLLLALALCGAVFFPKKTCAQLRYGLKAGVQVAEIQVHQFFQPNSSTPLLTFLASGVAEYELNKNLTLAAGLQVSGGGGSFAYIDSVDNVRDEYRHSLVFVQMPVILRVQHRSFSAGAGLYGGSALFGREKNTFTVFKTSTVRRDDLRFGEKGDDDYTRPDWGAVAEAGYSFRNFRAAAHYWLGLANVMPKYYREGGDKRQNRAYGASLTYYLGAGE
jgi:hypothetical protein